MNHSKLAVEFHWITDDEYIVATILSALTFKINSYVNRARYCIHYYGANWEGAKQYRDDPDLSFLQWRRVMPHLPRGSRILTKRAHVINRFIRFTVARRAASSKFIVLIDSDAFCSASLESIFIYLSSFSRFVAGVVEYWESRDAYLLLRPDGFQYRKPTGAKKRRVLHRVFGRHCSLSFPQLNNGFLIFRNCQKTVLAWETYYRKLLKESGSCNVEDDQVPLATAIQNTGVELIQLPDIFNSKGKVNGNYSVFHAWSRRWLFELRATLQEQYSRTTLQTLLATAISKWTSGQEAISTYFSKHQFGAFPTRYRSVEAFFVLEELYIHIASKCERGILEIGCQSRGRAALFLSELNDIERTYRRHFLWMPASRSKFDFGLPMLFSSLKVPEPIILVGSLATVIGSENAREIDCVLFESIDSLEIFHRTLRQIDRAGICPRIIAGPDCSGRSLEFDLFHELSKYAKRRGFNLKLMFRSFYLEKLGA